MAVLTILKAPHPTLTKKCEALTVFDEALKDFIQDMKDTMHSDEGCGLAANQVGVLKQIIITQPGREDPSIFVFINPSIVDQSLETCVMKEGCLSVPGNFIDVERPSTLTLRYQDIKGAFHEEFFDDLHARIILHEMDHLEGKLLIDYVSAFKRDMMLRKVKKLTHI
jgi:peptide deformylase